MNILLLSTFDNSGGAAQAAYRLHQGLQSIGADSKMLVRNKYSDDKTVIEYNNLITKLGARTSNFPLQSYPNSDRSLQFSSEWYPNRISNQVAKIAPDIINLHWVCGGYLQIEALQKFNQPIVWTLHDMWAFTGGCHYNRDCQRYTESCGACPQLKSSNKFDLSHQVWQRKAKAWKDLNITIVTPSVWLADCARSSSLFKNLRIEVIPYGIDIQTYKPFQRELVREQLNLPKDKALVLFGATTTHDVRKGFHYLREALLSLKKSGLEDKVELVVFGAAELSSLEDLGLKYHYLGKIKDASALARIYSAVDVFVAPSIQDNLPNTIMESIACGTPCVAFNIGGMPDMIEHQQNGYLAKPFEVEDLAQGITWVLEDKERHQKLCDRAREKAEKEFPLELQARRYLSLYGEILSK